jgi:hypothetical protein
MIWILLALLVLGITGVRWPQPKRGWMRDREKEDKLIRWCDGIQGFGVALLFLSAAPAMSLIIQGTVSSNFLRAYLGTQKMIVKVEQCIEEVSCDIRVDLKSRILDVNDELKQLQQDHGSWLWGAVTSNKIMLLRPLEVPPAIEHYRAYKEELEVEP